MDTACLKPLQNYKTDKFGVFIVLTFKLSAPSTRGDSSHYLILGINQRSQLLLKASVIYISEVVRFVSGFLLIIKATKYDGHHIFNTGEIYKACNISGLGYTKLLLGIGAHDKLHDSVVGCVQIMHSLFMIFDSVMFTLFVCSHPHCM